MASTLDQASIKICWQPIYLIVSVKLVQYAPVWGKADCISLSSLSVVWREGWIKQNCIFPFYRCTFYSLSLDFSSLFYIHSPSISFLIYVVFFYYSFLDSFVFFLVFLFFFFLHILLLGPFFPSISAANPFSPSLFSLYPLPVPTSVPDAVFLLFPIHMGVLSACCLLSGFTQGQLGLGFQDWYLCSSFLWLSPERWG